MSENFNDSSSLPDERIVLSIVMPAYNEPANLPVLYKRLVQVLGPLNLDWEWVVIDDHSTDDTFAVLCRLCEADARGQGDPAGAQF